MTRYLIYAFFFLLVTGCHPHIKQADEAFANGDYETALQIYRMDQREYYDSKKIRDRIAKTEKALEARNFAEIDALLKERKLNKVSSVYLSKKDEQRPPIANRIASYVETESSVLVEKEQFEEAYSLASFLAKKIPPHKEKGEKLADSIDAAWVKSLKTRLAAVPKSDIATAAMLHAKIWFLNADPAHRSKALELVAQVRKKHQFKVWIHAEEKSQQKFAKNLVSSALKNRSVSVVLGKNARKSDAMVSFKLGKPVFKYSKTVTEEAIEYESGTKKEINPEYERASEKIAELKNDIEMDKMGEDWDNAKINQEFLDDAEHDRSSIEQYIEVPAYATHSFNATTHTMTGTMQFSGNIRNSTAKFKTVNAKIKHSDVEHAAVAKAGLGRDPLKLPTEPSATKELQGKAKKHILFLVDSVVYRWRKKVMEKKTDAETLATFVILMPQIVDKKERVKIRQLYGFSDGGKVLSKLESKKKRKK